MKKIFYLITMGFFLISCGTATIKESIKEKPAPIVIQKSNKIKKIVKKKEKVLKDNITFTPQIDLKKEIKKEFSFETKKELEKEISEVHEELFVNNHIKIVVNNEVRKFIRLYSRNNGKWLYDAFKRAYIWLPYMKQIFKDYGLPEDLVYISFIESHFNFRARSRAGAVGPWQFMRRTAKKFGLKVDWWIDERKDPIKSTIAAAKYLKYLYSIFGSYELALSAYNAGEYKILKAIKRYKTKNYWKLCRKRFLKRETKSYVPSFYAVLFLIRNNGRLKFVPDDWVNYSKKDLIFVQISKPYSIYRISRKIGIPIEILKKLNPELRRGITPPGYENYLLKAPKKYENQLIALSKYIEKDYRYSFRTYRIRKGDSLYKIAKRFGIRNISLIKRLNNIKNVKRLQINQKILLPFPREKVVVYRYRYKREGRFVKYRVKKGDSLWKLSNKFNVSVKEIISWNNLSSSKIYPGDILKIKVR